MNIAFYIAAAISIFSTVMVITRFNIMHALLYLIVSLLSVAVIFYLYGAPFMAALEVIIYAGAIMVLIIFFVMMLNLGPETTRNEKQWLKPGMWMLPALLCLILLIELAYLIAQNKAPATGITPVAPKEVGRSLFGPYILAVELSAMLLMAGIVGAYHLGRQKKKILHRFFESNAS
ncbi:NADH-quinone oxidoreductase subunit J [uncultured Chitinophaga sp.]|jgi:NADH:ubiquinone oxidoreductase subunit 6 (chain J)|uniref:NADH-quinone oxidoreductase subunit J n=1 Tax=uncultured Chitinophaga sp. TaxID=339340 RepID=UPI00262FDDE4|nr:NADH-quinone oxidoreductase subunit J [uncultured Chitinophaga sp.]